MKGFKLGLLRFAMVAVMICVLLASCAEGDDSSEVNQPRESEIQTESTAKVTASETTAEPTETENETNEPTQSASETTFSTSAELEELKYFALGDSITRGYGLASPQTQSYPALIAESLTGKYDLAFSNLGVDGMTSSELLSALERGNASVAEADLITVTIGANNLLGPFTNALSGSLNAETTNLLGKYAMFSVSKDKSDLTVPNEVNELFKKVDASINGDKLAKELDDGIEQLRVDLPKIISKLRENAPGAKIVFTTVYNPFKDFKLSLPYVETKLDFSEMSNNYIVELNDVIEECCVDVTLVDIFEPFEKSEVRVVNVNTASLIGISFDPHPNAAGHTLISETLIENIEA